MTNSLTLDKAKCIYMSISCKRSPSTPLSPLLLEGCPLDEVNGFRYLSVLLSHDLSWGEHVSTICSKARRILGLLYRRFYNNCSGDSLLQLYLSLVRPHLDYASAVWSPHLKKDRDALESIQKFACHMATRAWDSSYHDLLHCKNMRIVLTQFGYPSCNSRVTSYACSCRNNKWSAFPC